MPERDQVISVKTEEIPEERNPIITAEVPSPTRASSVAPVSFSPSPRSFSLNLESRILDVADQLNRVNRQEANPLNQFQPFEIDPSVSPAGQFEKVAEQQTVGTTHVALRWIKPPDPEIERFEIWAKNVAFESQEPFLVQANVDSPASVTLNADSDTPVVLYLRTIMKNGLSSDLNSSPTVSTAITLEDPSITSADQIAPGIIQDQHFDRLSADKIQILAADIVTLTAAQITAGTLAAGVILASNIAATQISAGTMSAVNVSAGTYSLISGNEQMLINGTVGFLQYNSLNDKSVGIFGGTANWSNGNDIYVNIDADATGGLIDVFDTGGDLDITLFSDSAGGHIRVREGSDTKVALEVDGSSNGFIAINGTKVLGPQEADPGASPTTDQLRDILLAHGLIG